MATLNIRKMDRATAARIKTMGDARGWTYAQTLEAIVGAVMEIREVNEERPNELVTALLEESGLAFVRV